MNNDFNTNFYLGVQSLKQQQFKQAEKYLLACIKINPRAWEPYNNLGAIYFSQKNWAIAQKYFNVKFSYDRF